jgi:acetoin utilization deacetylase AcuC-like enzyme
VWVSLVRDVVIPVARSYEPQLVLVSAGFDAHSEDPLADCRVSDAGFAAMAWLVRGLAQELGVPVGAVMEGGYNVDVLARCVALTMDVLAGGDPAAQALELAGAGGDGAGGPACGVPDALALEARARLRQYWPVLG